MKKLIKELEDLKDQIQIENEVDVDTTIETLDKVISVLSQKSKRQDLKKNVTKQELERLYDNFTNGLYCVVLPIE